MSTRAGRSAAASLANVPDYTSKWAWNSSSRRDAVAAALEGEPIVLTRFNQLEMLQGCRDEKEWSLLASYLEDQDYLDLSDNAWQEAARTYYDLRRMGHTVRSPIDCCIAQAGWITTSYCFTVTRISRLSL
jgi:predicted nucleic acid-binding protein